MSLGARQFVYMLLTIPAILIATTVHEAARALVSTLLGDDAPRRDKRLSLNPVRHFEPIGFLLMYSTGLSYGVGVGWGKPVDTNPRRYANRRTGVVLTAVGPSIANFLVALLCSFALKYVMVTSAELDSFLVLTLQYNLYIVACNFLPVVPFDCIKIVVEFVSKKNYFSISQSESIMQLIMVLLIFTGLLTMILNPIYNLLAAFVAILTI